MASEKNLSLKKTTVQTIIDKIKNSETVILFTYQGLSVADISNLRRKLRSDDAEVKVYKNTLVKRALTELKLDLDEFLAGPNALLFSTKLLEAIKALTEFAKDHELLNIRAGIIKGDVVSLDTINEYATIPSMEGLLTMLAGGMLEHVRNLSISLNLYAEELNDGKPTPAPQEVIAEEKTVETSENSIVEEPVASTEEVPTENAEKVETEEVTKSNEED